MLSARHFPLGPFLLWNTILFWNLSSATPSNGPLTSSSTNVVKLAPLSAQRFPAIILQLSNSHKSHSDCAGHLFVYGGDEIGSEGVLTVLTLEWPPGMETVRCNNHADLTLSCFLSECWSNGVCSNVHRLC